MKVSCNKFSPIKIEGAKVTCLYYQKPLCSLPKNFLCSEAERRLEVRQRQWHSYSSIVSFLSCQRKYYYQYILRLECVRRPEWAIRGNLFHEGMRAYYSENIMTEIITETKIHSIVSPVLKAYIEFYSDRKEGLQIEQKYSIDNPSLIAYVDSVDGRGSSKETHK